MTKSGISFLLYGTLLFTYFVSSSASAQDTVVVIPLGGSSVASCSGTAEITDVVGSETFCSTSGTNLTGVRPVAPVATTGIFNCYDEDGVDRECDGTGTDTGEDYDHNYGATYRDMRFLPSNGGYHDPQTGLIWGDQGSTAKEWQEALDECNNKIIIGNGTYDDWRLPNIRELFSVINFGVSSPAITPSTPTPSDPVPLTSSAFFWSSTTSNASTGAAWHIDMSTGAVATATKVDVSPDIRVWCVRGGIKTGF